MATSNNTYHTKEERIKQQRFNNIKHTLRIFEAIVEVIVFAIMFFLMWKYFYRRNMNPYDGMGQYLLLLVYIVLTSITFKLNDSIEFGHLKFANVFSSQIISLLLVNIITYFQLSLMANHLLSVIPMFCFYVAELIVSMGLVLLYTFVYHRFNVPQDMLLIYGNENAVMLKFKMDSRVDKYHVTSVININKGHEAIHQEMLKHDSVILNDIPAEIRNNILKECYKYGIRTYIVPKISDVIIRGAEEITLFDTPLLLSRGRGLSPFQRFVKRLGDITVSSIAMLFFIPVYLIVALAIKIEDGGPVFYTQERITFNEKHFKIYKFRSMVVDAEKGGYDISTMMATSKDSRITRVGSVIRKTRIDELPQILNILKGDMSVVGPRPERVENVKAYCNDIPEFVYRYKVKGGLTGFAQIYGKYNTSAYDKLKLDLMYIENYSMLLDLKLILMTIQIMFKAESTEGADKAVELRSKKEELLMTESNKK